MLKPSAIRDFWRPGSTDVYLIGPRNQRALKLEKKQPVMGKPIIADGIIALCRLGERISCLTISSAARERPFTTRILIVRAIFAKARICLARRRINLSRRH